MRTEWICADLFSLNKSFQRFNCEAFNFYKVFVVVGKKATIIHNAGGGNYGIRKFRIVELSDLDCFNNNLFFEFKNRSIINKCFQGSVLISTDFIKTQEFNPIYNGDIIAASVY
jgi:hypothetical protein